MAILLYGDIIYTIFISVKDKMTVQFDAETLSIGVSIFLFTLASLYTLADYEAIFDKNTFLKKLSNPIKYSIAYVMSYMTYIFKALLVMFFVFIFIIVYNILIVGIFKPLLSENIGSQNNLKAAGFAMGAYDIIEKARKTYFEAIQEVIKKGMLFVFGMFKVQYLGMILLIIIPVFLSFVATAYYTNVQTKQKQKQKTQNLLLNYHLLMIIMFIVLVISLVFIAYLVMLTR